MNIYDQAKTISNQQDFIEFLKLFRKDYQENKDKWENDDLMSFLEGLQGYSIDKQQETISWKILAELLLAAIVYE